MLKKFYMALASSALLFYGTASALGWEITSEPRQRLPADARQSPGGYRSFHFWHSGYRGGK
ncbi:MAG TPA: hypothetical protein VGP72_15050 [Planctomycetota bacterium]|jgi:hypothetical protein